MKKTKGKVYEYLAWLPAIVVVVMIFVLSSQNGSDSKEASSSVAVVVAEKTRLGVDFDDIWKTEGFDAFNQWIRTLAHMAEYGIFSLCVAFAVTVNGFRGKMRFIYTGILSISLSVLDEFYQIFVPDRYGDLIDVFFDSLSAMLVALLIYVTGAVFSRKKKKTVEYTPFQDTEILERRRTFMSVWVDSITLENVLQIFKEWIQKKEKFHYIVTPNADHMVKLEKDEKFRTLYEKADLILTDGQPLMWIADSLGNPITEKIPGSDLLPHVCKVGAELGASLFILGTTDEIAGRAIEKIKQQHSGLKIAGNYSPDMGFEKNEEQQKKAIEMINASNADILVLALGSPKQEKFIYDNRDKIKVSLALPIGAAVDFMAGAVNRAPKWMRRSGLEWLYRFLQEPGRLFRRYFVDDMKIFYLAWRYRHQIKGNVDENII